MDEWEVNIGIPHESILGPILFLSFINDLCNLKLRNGNKIYFADDTAFLYGDPWEEVCQLSQIEFSTVAT